VFSVTVAVSAGTKYQIGRRALSVENSGARVVVGNDDTNSVSRADLLVTGHATVNQMFGVKKEAHDAADAITCTTSYCSIKAKAGTQKNVISVTTKPAGTLLFVENLDDQATGGDGGEGACDCNPRYRCFFIHDGTAFQRYGNVAIA